MPSIRRPLADTSLRFAIPEEARQLSESDLLARSGRSARTLVKDGALRVTMVALGRDGHLAAHQSPGPITIQAVAGRIAVSAGTDRWELEPGALLFLGAGIEHEVASDTGGAFLLTVAASSPESDDP